MEIERKFLVVGDFSPLATHSSVILQAYLACGPDVTVRVRLSDGRGYLTVKGPCDARGFSHREYEYLIPADEAAEIISFSAHCVEKERFYVPNGLHTIEVDVFRGRHSGLVIAEIELRSEDEPFERPAWLGREVTGEHQYYNSWLSQH
ncbi:MAG: CYTH domain-containing protein [Dysgonamonadaceae bacterium]|nr:CYTH domain-containing protein [Dysgonamonadaceae bacterium]